MHRFCPVSFSLLLSLLLTLHAQNHTFPKVDVFVRGESGYFCLKIPYLLHTTSNVLLAFSEARRGSCSDYAPTDLVMKRSLDGGVTWLPLTVLSTDGFSVFGNAAPVEVHRPGGAPRRILLPFCVNNSAVLMRYSDTDGASWSPVHAVSNSTRPEWLWIGLGPPGAIQLTQGPAAGRVLVPAYHAPFHRLDGTFTHGHALVSDDFGGSWSVAGTMYGDHFSNECQAVELANGTVAVFSRGLFTFRLRTLSHDAGQSFEPTEALALPQPMDGCEGSTILNPSAPPGSGALLYSGLADGNLLGRRYNLSIFTSHDSGVTWTPRVTVFSGSSAYSSLVGLPGTTVNVALWPHVRPELLTGSSVAGLLYEWSKEVQPVFLPDAISFTVLPPFRG